MVETRLHTNNSTISQILKLTSRARNFLERGGRSIDCPNPLDVGQELIDAGLPAFDPVIETLVDVGGYWHPIGLTGTFKIFSVTTAIKHSDSDCGSTNPDEFRLAFGVHPTAQFNFWLDGNGRVFADSILIHDSAAEWIESYAVLEMVERWKNCVRIVLPEPTGGFVNWANSQFQIERPASGKNGRWWLGSEWALWRFRPWSVDESEYWIWLFATNRANGESMSSKFTRSFNLNPLEISDWP